jgi:two-component system chemotaxis response regulator CheB
MTVRVLIVDDSSFFRRRLTEIFKADSHIEVVGNAANGQEGVERALALKPDVITMDIEMPVMDGITAVRRIMAAHPTPVMMFSSLSTEGAQATLDALEAGAMDFLPKRLEDIAQNSNDAIRTLCLRVRMLGLRGIRHAAPRTGAARPPARPAPAVRAHTNGHQYRLVGIGASTGGPVALQQVLKALPGNFPVPVLLVQHMPGTFTGPFAERLDQVCEIAVREAVDGDALVPGTALLAPGGRQMVVEARNGAAVVRIRDSEASQHYRPCIDSTFTSIAKQFASGTLALILTGMGADGREGARVLKQGGATVWAQDEKSCVVYGMPAAVVEAGLADQILPLSEIGPGLAHEVAGWIS